MIAFPKLADKLFFFFSIPPAAGLFKTLLLLRSAAGLASDGRTDSEHIRCVTHDSEFSEAFAIFAANLKLAARGPDVQKVSDIQAHEWTFDDFRFHFSANSSWILCYLS